MIMLFIMLVLMVLSCWMYMRKDPYYVRMEDAGHDKEAMKQAIKIELETTMQRAEKIVDNAPYLIVPGNRMHCHSLAQVIRANGGRAKVVRKRLLQKKEAFVEGPIRE